MSKPYITPHHLAELRDQLHPVDWAIVADVRSMRLATAGDLQALHGLREPVHVRQFRRRLQRLHELGVLFRLERRIGGVRAGSAGFVYGLGSAGQRLLDTSGSEVVRRPWTPRPAWLRHALATSHLYVVLRQAEAAGAIRLLDYQPEPDCWRTFKEQGADVTLKPDAFVRYETTDSLVSQFVEVDMGTESPATLARKAEVYLRYWQSGEEQDAHGVFPEVLWLAPDDERCRVIQQATTARWADAPALHQVARYDQAGVVLVT